MPHSTQNNMPKFWFQKENQFLGHWLLILVVKTTEIDGMGPFRRYVLQQEPQIQRISEDHLLVFDKQKM